MDYSRFNMIFSPKIHAAIMIWNIVDGHTSNINMVKIFKFQMFLGRKSYENTQSVF